MKRIIWFCSLFIISGTASAMFAEGIPINLFQARENRIVGPESLFKNPTHVLKKSAFQARMDSLSLEHEKIKAIQISS